MSRQCKRVCDNCLSEIAELLGYWHVERVKEHRDSEYVHNYSEPRLIWDFCGVPCLVEKLQDWQEVQKLGLEKGHECNQ